MQKLNRKILPIFFSMLFLFATSSMGADCAAGGPNSTGCTFRTTVKLWGLTLWSIEGSSVSGCSNGTYACCNADGASCESDSSIGGGEEQLIEE